MKLFPSKKGLTDTILESVFWLVYIVIISTATIYIMTIMSRVNIDAHQLRADLFVERLIYSPAGIIYTDELSERSYPGIIDAERFTRQNVDRLFNVGDPQNPNSLVSANITLRDMAGNDLLDPIEYNPERYDFWRRLLWDRWAYSKIEYDKYVSLKVDMFEFDQYDQRIALEMEELAADPDITFIGPLTPEQEKTIMPKRDRLMVLQDELRNRQHLYAIIKRSPGNTVPAVLHVTVITPNK